MNRKFYVTWRHNGTWSNIVTLKEGDKRNPQTFAKRLTEYKRENKEWQNGFECQAPFILSWSEYDD